MLVLDEGRDPVHGDLCAVRVALTVRLRKLSRVEVHLRHVLEACVMQLLHQSRHEVICLHADVWISSNDFPDAQDIVALRLLGDAQPPPRVSHRPNREGKVDIVPHGAPPVHKPLVGFP